MTSDPDGARATGDTSELHHGSHHQLLSFLSPHDRRDSGVRGRGIDAVVVPTFRPHNSLRDALMLTRELSCPLVALCSGPAQAQHVVKLSRALGSEVVAVDLHDVKVALPPSSVDKLLARTGFPHGSDLSVKRNLGLLLGRLLGWRRVLFLDDDIAGVRADELPGAAAHLDGGFRAVGLGNTGFPDNSVVCHAYRAVGGRQESFIGGGAMIVDPSQTRSFFPNIYNEDWFFLLGDGVPFKAAVSGTMVQRSFDPFASSRRAAGEEFGDTLAEGLFWLLDSGFGLENSHAAFWGDFLFRRRQFLDHVLALVDDKLGQGQRPGHIRASLRAALGQSATISPWLCDAFVDAWRLDLTVWAQFLEHFTLVDTVDKALAELGLSHVAVRSTA